MTFFPIYVIVIPFEYLIVLTYFEILEATFIVLSNSTMVAIMCLLLQIIYCYENETMNPIDLINIKIVSNSN